MRQLLLICLIVLPSLIQAETISLTVPSAVAEQIDVYRASCAEDGGQLELDGDEVFKVWTDEGQEAYVIHAAFTCGRFGHDWCGAMGHCQTQLVIDNRLYETNRILQVALVSEILAVSALASGQFVRADDHVAACEEGYYLRVNAEDTVAVQFRDWLLEPA